MPRRTGKAAAADDPSKNLIKLINSASYRIYNFSCRSCIDGHRGPDCEPGKHGDRVLYVRPNTGRPVRSCKHKKGCDCPTDRNLCVVLARHELDAVCRGERPTVHMFTSPDEMKALTGLALNTDGTLDIKSSAMSPWASAHLAYPLGMADSPSCNTAVGQVMPIPAPIQSVLQPLSVAATMPAWNTQMSINTFIPASEPNTLIGTSPQLGTDLEIGTNLQLGSDFQIGTNLQLGTDFQIGTNVPIGTDLQLGPNVPIGTDPQLGADFSFLGVQQPISIFDPAFDALSPVDLDPTLTQVPNMVFSDMFDIPGIDFGNFDLPTTLPTDPVLPDVKQAMSPEPLIQFGCQRCASRECTCVVCPNTMQNGESSGRWAQACSRTGHRVEKKVVRKRSKDSIERITQACCGELSKDA